MRSGRLLCEPCLAGHPIGVAAAAAAVHTLKHVHAFVRRLAPLGQSVCALFIAVLRQQERDCLRCVFEHIVVGSASTFAAKISNATNGTLTFRIDHFYYMIDDNVYVPLYSCSRQKTSRRNVDRFVSAVSAATTQYEHLCNDAKLSTQPSPQSPLMTSYLDASINPEHGNYVAAAENAAFADAAAAAVARNAISNNSTMRIVQLAN